VIMSRTRRALLTITLTPTLALIGAQQCAVAASAAPTAQISGLRAADQELHFVLAVSGLEAGTIVDTSNIRVSAGGQSLTAHAAAQLRPSAPNTPSDPSASSAQQRQAMLVVDASGSMQGSRLAAAKAAALSYAAALPADVKVGLVSFSAHPATLLAPTADRAALRTALSHLAAVGDTALYDAVLAGVAAFGPRDASAQRRMLILSDGADTTSQHMLSAATAAVTGSGIGVDAIGIDLSGLQRTVLQRITAAGSGRVLSTQGLDQLDSAFVDAAETFSQQVTVTADIPASLAGQHVKILTTVTAAGHAITATASFQLPTLARPAPAPSHAAATSSHLATTKLPLAVLVLTFLGLLGVGLLALGNPKPSSDRDARLDQLGDYRWSAAKPAAEATAPPVPAERMAASVALSLVDRLIRLGRSRTRIAADLERAGLRMRPQEWILLRISAGIALIALLTVLSASLLIGLLLGTLLAWLGTRFLLKVKAARRCAAFADQLPDMLQLIASSLRSGFSLSQALDGVVREGAQPAASEFARALTEARLGVALEDALDQGAERMKSQDLAWVVMAVRISRDVGGNLAEVLLTTVHTMRERVQLKRQIRALSAEGRLSAYILIALPILVAGWFALVRPDYLRPLYTVAPGITMLVVAVLGVLIGSWWMSRIVKVEV
jgi:Flp pilus assembly protein TadB/Mg-chelatase subunit ChlD